MVVNFLADFFGRLYRFMMDLYMFPELRKMALAGMKHKMVGGGPKIDNVYDSYGGCLPTQHIQGVPLPPFPGLSDNVAQLEKFQARNDDIWIVNWPKSGTHWTWEIVMMLSSGRAEIKDSLKLGAMYPEVCSLDGAEKMSSPRVLDTHVPPKLFPKAALKSKIIFTVRNPKDACVSFYYHLKGMTAGAAYTNCTWNGVYEFAMNGKIHYGSWFDHLEAWMAVLENNPNALIVTYEDMKQDLKKQVRRVAEFIGHQQSEKFYDEVTELCTFGSMKKKKKDPKSAWSKESTGIYRKGIVGDWKNHFTVAQNEEFNEIYQERMKKVKLDLRFEL